MPKIKQWSGNVVEPPLTVFAVVSVVPVVPVVAVVPVVVPVVAVVPAAVPPVVVVAAMSHFEGSAQQLLACPPWQQPWAVILSLYALMVPCSGWPSTRSDAHVASCKMLRQGALSRQTRQYEGPDMVPIFD